MAENEGWGFPNGSRKAHYFRGMMALCRKYGFYGEPLETDDEASPDDCAVCRKHLSRHPAPKEQ